MKRNRNVAVIGASVADAQTAETAYEVGREIARENWVLLCGGLGGVMEAAARGAYENGGTTVGILPGPDHADGNAYLTIILPTALGHARNAVIATGADALIAVGGEYGTLSELALGLKMGKPVVSLGSWDAITGVVAAASANEAVGLLKSRLA